MRRSYSVPVLLALVLGGAVLLGGQPGIGAQDATPPAARPAGTPEAVRASTLASGTIEITAPGTAGLALGRIRYAPGASSVIDATNSAVSLVYMAEGALTLRVAAPLAVARSAGPGTPVPDAPEAVAADAEFTMVEGESVMIPPAVAGEVRNDGDVDAIAWVVNVALRGSEPGTPQP